MIGTLWAFVRGSKAGRFIGYIVAGLLAVLGIWAAGKREGAQRASEKARQADQKNAKNIEDRADEAIRNHGADKRNVDEQLHDRGKLRD